MTASAPSPPPPPPSDDSSSSRRASREDALAVVRRLRDAGHIAYFAGGCVRDQLLGLEPKDYDVATDAPPDRVRQLFSNTQAVGAAFGVILVRHRKSQIEVATFRTDLKYIDGRRPEGVVFTTAEEDAKRRDFTINGMFFDPVENKVIDYVGGQEDLKKNVLRAIGEPNLRFQEDYLRLLRSIRFAARFNMNIDPATDAAIRANAPHLKQISPERIGDELRLMLTPSSKAAAWTLLENNGLAREVFRHWRPFHAEPPHHAWWVFHALGREPAPFGLALAAAFVSRSVTFDEARDVRECFDRKHVNDAVRAMRQALKISNAEADEMSGTLAGIAPLLADHEATLAQKKRFLAQPTAALSRRLMAAMAHADLFRKRIRALEAEFVELLKDDPAPPPLVTGDDLTAAGVTPGPVFKRMLDAVYDAQLEDRVRTKEEALALALELARGG
jgi:poly(A) polymerase